VGTQTDLKIPTGEGWTRLAQAVAAEVPPAEVDGVWVFRAIRQEAREWGTAIVSRVEGERRRIYTARYVHTIKGKERGAWTGALEEVGSGPVEALDELIKGVEKRADDELPTRIPPTDWFPPAPDGPTYQG
jgi:hypothetical protein